MILPPTSTICHHHKVTNITVADPKTWIKNSKTQFSFLAESSTRTFSYQKFFDRALDFYFRNEFIFFFNIFNKTKSFFFPSETSKKKTEKINAGW